MRPPHQSAITVCGVARNVALDLEKEVAKIQRALVDFREVNFVVVESLSADRTVNTLQKLAENNPNFYYESIQHSELASIFTHLYLEKINKSLKYPALNTVVLREIDWQMRARKSFDNSLAILALRPSFMS